MSAPVLRRPRPEDLHRFRLPTRPRLSPAGDQAAFVVQTAAPGFDGYRQAVGWSPPTGPGRPAR